MRINHNIASLNTYRQLSANNSNGAKSLEKLSSGLRINRAGDDAAGLAISEKMRGQIRGLDQASRNAQDGISLIQTAEGALNETHSMLQRIRELSLQSANGTTTDAEKQSIQAEVSQFKTEINHIAHDTEFNGIKLLDGSISQTGTSQVTNGQVVTTIIPGGVGGTISGVSADGLVFTNIDTSSAQGGYSKEWNYEVTSGTSGDGTATYTFKGCTVSLVSSGAGSGHVVSGATGTSATITVGTTTDVSDIGDELTNAFNAIKAAGGDTSALADFEFYNFGSQTSIQSIVTGTQYNADTIVFNAGTTGTTYFNNSGTEGTATSPAFWFQNITNAGTFSVGTGTVQFQGVTLTIDTDDGGDNVGSNSLTTGTSGTLTIDKDCTSLQMATAISKSFEAIRTAGGPASVLNDFTFLYGPAIGGSLYIVSNTGTTAYNSEGLDFTNTSNGITTADLNTPTLPGTVETRGQYSFTIDTAINNVGTTLSIGAQTFTAVASGAAGNQFNIGTDEDAQALSIATAINNNAELSRRFNVTTAANGKVILTEKVGRALGAAYDIGGITLAGNNTVAGWYSSAVNTPVPVGGKYTIDGVDITVTSNAGDAGIAAGTSVLYDATPNGQSTNLRTALANNATLSAKYTVGGAGNTITLSQRAGQESSTAPVVTTSYTNNGVDTSLKVQIGANRAQAMDIAIQDMSTVGLALSSIDVSSTTGADSAIGVIDNAIDLVSEQRSYLGALQNRLEHTINNLGTSSENLTFAESHIRDVDMAKEMMEFTKNNILSQAATAMLAQANQIPQGVLQLLRA